MKPDSNVEMKAETVVLRIIMHKQWNQIWRLF